MPFIIAVVICTFMLLCATCGYAAYWATGGQVDIEVWRTIAVMWGIDAPCIVVTGLMIHAETI